MTNHQSPVTPPPELRRLWAQQAQRIDLHDPVAWMQYVSEKAAQWGADQELEACCEWLEQNQGRWEIPMALRDARRPEPPSLKEQALLGLSRIESSGEYFSDGMKDLATIRRALEELPE